MNQEWIVSSFIIITELFVSGFIFHFLFPFEYEIRLTLARRRHDTVHRVCRSEFKDRDYSRLKNARYNSQIQKEETINK